MVDFIAKKTGFKQHSLISAKEIMAKFRLSYQTINHYTNFGLLPLVFKKGNVRFYDRGLVKERLVKINKLAKEGYSLYLIRKKLIGI